MFNSSGSFLSPIYIFTELEVCDLHHSNSELGKLLFSRFYFNLSPVSGFHHCLTFVFNVNFISVLFKFPSVTDAMNPAQYILEYRDLRNEGNFLTSIEV